MGEKSHEAGGWLGAPVWLKFAPAMYAAALTRGHSLGPACTWAVLIQLSLCDLAQVLLL